METLASVLAVLSVYYAIMAGVSAVQVITEGHDALANKKLTAHLPPCTSEQDIAVYKSSKGGTGRIGLDYAVLLPDWKEEETCRATSVTRNLSKKGHKEYKKAKRDRRKAEKRASRNQA